jgi:hypothetical protein
MGSSGKGGRRKPHRLREWVVQLLLEEGSVKRQLLWIMKKEIIPD